MLTHVPSWLRVLRAYGLFHLWSYSLILAEKVSRRNMGDQYCGRYVLTFSALIATCLIPFSTTSLAILPHIFLIVRWSVRIPESNPNGRTTCGHTASSITIISLDKPDSSIA